MVWPRCYEKVPNVTERRGGHTSGAGARELADVDVPYDRLVLRVASVW